MCIELDDEQEMTTEVLKEADGHVHETVRACCSVLEGELWIELEEEEDMVDGTVETKGVFMCVEDVLTVLTGVDENGKITAANKISLISFPSIV